MESNGYDIWRDLIKWGAITLISLASSCMASNTVERIFAPDVPHKEGVSVDPPAPVKEEATK